MSKELRPYQEIALRKIEDALHRGVSKMLLTLATGLGKSLTAVSATKGYKRVLWITHTEELLSQSGIAFIRERFNDTFAEKVESVGFIEYVKQSQDNRVHGGFSMGIIKADNFYPDADVVLASIATIHRRLDRLSPEMFDAIVVDEAHLSAAKTWVKTLEFFKPKLLLGLTATPRRSDNMLLGDIYDEIVYDYGIKEGIENKYLCELDAIRIKTTTSLDSVRTTAGELNQKDLSEEINSPERNQIVVTNYLKYAKGRQGIFYCVDVDHAIKLAEIFNEMGVPCKAVSANEELTPDRSLTIKAFKNRELMVLTNCMILTAGVDIPNVSCIGQSTPTKSLTKYIQTVGRGTRLKDEQHVKKFGQNCLILDFIDTTSRHNLVNAWELDKEKEPEDRVFITQEKRDKLIADRKRKVLLKIKREEDERVSLLRIPKPKLNKSIRMKDAATPAQLKWISDLGYDVVNENYTKEMCSQIIMDLPATDKQRWLLKSKRYDVDSVTVLTRGMVQAAMLDFEKREAKLKKKLSTPNTEDEF